MRTFFTGFALLTALCGSIACGGHKTLPTPPADPLTLSSATLDLDVDQMKTLTVLDTPAPAVRWTSSDAAVATVSADGTVTAIAPGKATVTATEDTGATRNDPVIHPRVGTCAVTVTAAEVPEMEGVTLSGTTWATANVGEPGEFVAAAELPGRLYQWGRRTPWSATLFDQTLEGWAAEALADEAWPTEADPCPTGWRIPTAEELNALLGGSVLPVAAVRNGVQGYSISKFPTGGSIFLPRTGYRTAAGKLQGRATTDQVEDPESGAGSTIGAATHGYYWSSEGSGTGTGARAIRISDEGISKSNGSSKKYAFAVRCVKR